MEIELAQDELKNLAKTWILVIISLTYCYFLGKITKKGLTRLLFIFPIIILFLFLPLNLTSVHFIGTTSFFISWLATFKLLLFAAGRGPLASSDQYPPLSFPLFISVACLPIKINHPTRQKDDDPDHQLQDYHHPDHRNGKFSTLNLVVKAAFLGIMIKIYEYSDRMHKNLIWIIYCFHIYFALELILAAVAAVVVRVLHRVELEPQFDAPILTTSLQDFWGRRWNLMVTSILRPTVYEPVLGILAKRVGYKAARVMAVLATFVVSGAMHEVVFFHIGRVKPTFEVTWFFLIHGVGVCVEMAVKKVVGGRRRLNRVVSWAATVGFVFGTGFWLFLPPFLRGGVDVRAFHEYAVVGEFSRNVSRSLVSGVDRWF